MLSSTLKKALSIREGEGGGMQDPLHHDKKWFWFFVLFGVGFFRIFVVIVFLFCYFPLQIYGPEPIGLR